MFADLLFPTLMQIIFWYLQNLCRCFGISQINQEIFGIPKIDADEYSLHFPHWQSLWQQYTVTLDISEAANNRMYKKTNDNMATYVP